MNSLAIAILTIVLAALVTGAMVYSFLILVASRGYLASRRSAVSGHSPPISLLKPLYGLDLGLEDNLRSFFVQGYPQYEVIFAVHRADDPAAAVAQKIMAEYSGKVPARLVVSGDSPIPNGKAFSLNRLVNEAQHDLLVMCDSDVRVEPDFLRRLAQEFADPRVGLSSCPYLAVAGTSLWSRLEAIGMNTEFLGGVMVARMLEGMKFALGPALAVRRSVLDQMGGFAYLQEFLAEDFVMGQRAAELGHTVLLSSCVVEHHIGSQEMKKNLGHRLRWARSTRRSRPAGYFGQIFTYPLPWALLLLALHGSAWPIFLLALVLRYGAAWATAEGVLHDPLTRRQWWLLPLQDLMGFAVWMGGYIGGTIIWRDRKCTLLPDGRLQVDL